MKEAVKQPDSGGADGFLSEWLGWLGLLPVATSTVAGREQNLIPSAPLSAHSSY